MSRLPTPGGDSGTWGTILNDFLSQSHNADGTQLNASVNASSLNAGTGSNTQVLTYDSTQTGGFKWAAPAPVSPTGAAGGDLTGTYPNPTVNTTDNIRSVIRGVGYNVFNITDPKYGTAGQGNATNDTAALAAAHADAVAAGGGVIYAPAGTYLINTWPTFETVGYQLPYAIRGDGKELTIFKSYATNLASSLTITCPTYDPNISADFGSVWGGFTIDGGEGYDGDTATINVGSGAVGIHWQNVSGATFRDISILNFPNGDGFYFNNVNGWCERITIDGVEISNCGSCLRYAVQSNGYGSFDYWSVTGLWVAIFADQSAVVSEVSTSTHGTAIDRVGTKFYMVANCYTGYASNSGKLFWIKGQDKWTDVEWHVNAEMDGGNPYAHTTVQIDSTADGQMTGWGVFEAFSLAPCVFASGTWQFQIQGLLAVNGISGTGTWSEGSMTAIGRVKRYLFNLPSGYPSSVTSGTSWQNTIRYDVFVTIPVTFSATAGTAKWNVDVWSGLPAGTITVAAGSNHTASITFVHYAGTWARVDVTNATLGTPIVRPV